MTSPIFYVTEGVRIIISSWKSRFRPHKYEGNAEEICRQIVSECWNGKFFQTSTSNFAQFWSRDFGWCTRSLLNLGYKKEVHKTIRYALNTYQKKGEVTTTITPKGTAYNYPYYAVDSLPWLIHSIKISKYDYDTHIPLLNKEIQRFYRLVVDPQNNLVKKSENFSSMKDFSIRQSSCYDNCMLAMLAMDLFDMKLYNPFKVHQPKLKSKKEAQQFYSKLLTKELWNGKYFFDDLQRKDYVAGDANLFPFILGIIKDKSMLKSAIKQIQNSALDQPLPLKYTSSRKDIKFIWQEWFFRNYESDSVWTHMGPLYVMLLKEVDKNEANAHKEDFTRVIEKYQGFPEVLFANGKPFHSPVYYCDRGMLWAANYLTL
jgi:hypothetical protein